jgi:GNAT superfamily N-acetyltransferase
LRPPNLRILRVVQIKNAGWIERLRYFSVPSTEVIEELKITLPKNDFNEIEEITTSDGFRILDVNRYLFLHRVTTNITQPEIPTQSEIQKIYPRFDAKQISEHITEKRIFSIRSTSNEIAGLVIITRRNSMFSEISMRTMPRFLRQGYGIRILQQAIQHEIDSGLIVVFVTELENIAANALIAKLEPDRHYQERMVIN